MSFPSQFAVNHGSLLPYLLHTPEDSMWPWVLRHHEAHVFIGHSNVQIACFQGGSNVDSINLKVKNFLLNDVFSEHTVMDRCDILSSMNGIGHINFDSIIFCLPSKIFHFSCPPQLLIVYKGRGIITSGHNTWYLQPSLTISVLKNYVTCSTTPGLHRQSRPCLYLWRVCCNHLISSFL